MVQQFFHKPIATPQLPKTMFNRFLFPVAVIADGCPLEVAEVVYTTKKCQTLAVPKHGLSGWRLTVTSQDGQNTAEVFLVIYDAKTEKPGWYAPVDFEKNKQVRSDVWKSTGLMHKRHKKGRPYSILEMRGCYVGPV